MRDRVSRGPVSAPYFVICAKRNLRLREDKLVAQGHTACLQGARLFQGQGSHLRSDPGLLNVSNTWEAPRGTSLWLDSRLTCRGPGLHPSPVERSRDRRSRCLCQTHSVLG
jgi:hypothetical protein